MSFFYRLQPVRDNINRKNPKTGLMPMAVSVGSADLDKLAKTISERTSYSRPVVKAILQEMVDETERLLSYGQNVTLGDLGTFSVSAEGPIVETPDDIRGTSIKLKRIVHRSSRTMTKRLKDIPWERVAWEKSTARPRKK